MIIDAKDRKPVLEKNVLGGQGTETEWAVFDYKAVDAPKNCSLFMEVEYPPGTGTGYHQHHGAGEIYYILSGKGRYNDNGTEVILGPGDSAVSYDGQSHCMTNDGPAPLRFLAVMFTSDPKEFDAFVDQAGYEHLEK